MNACSWVYILASGRNGTLYTGVTTKLTQRTWEHRTGQRPGFTDTYGVKTLVWYETHAYVGDAIKRETSIKRWRRGWKLALIEANNPQWRDLYEDLFKVDGEPQL